MSQHMTNWRNIFPALQASAGTTTGVAAENNLNLYHIVDGEVVKFSMKSTEKTVVLSINPVLLAEDARTKYLNRAISLGYEPVVNPTVNPRSR